MSDLIERPLGADVRREINELASVARDLLDLGATGGRPKEIVAAIDHALTTSGWLARTGLEADEAAIALGSLWGVQLTRAFTWEWVALHEPDSEEDDAHVGVVSPDRRFVVFPTYFIRALLQPDSDVTALLTFNMIASGTLPPADAGAYVELGAPSGEDDDPPPSLDRPGMSEPIDPDAVYKLLPIEGGEWIVPENGDYDTALYCCDGTPLADGWIPIPVQHEPGVRRPSAFPWCGHNVVVMRQRALDVLRPIVERHGEILPLASRGEPLFMLNVTTVVDGLDQAASELVRFADGAIMDIPRHAFRADVISGVDVFKLSGLRASMVYVTGKVIQAALAAGLDGFAWEKLWSPTAPDAAQSQRRDVRR